MRAVFLDRDGTLIEDVGYLDRVGRLRLFPWSVDAVRLLNRAGLEVIVVTNQAGVARGVIEEQVVCDLHAHISGLFEAGGARLDAWYYCPHLPESTIERYRVACACRKPGPGMIRRAEQERGIDAARSFVVGDRWLDVELGHGVGATSLMVRTGYGATEALRPRPGVAVAAVVSNLMEAVSWILRRVREEPAPAGAR
jgi:D-glycero-D-manno-heptose 1,7-bisphosphate phosphatase